MSSKEDEERGSESLQGEKEKEEEVVHGFAASCDESSPKNDPDQDVLAPTLLLPKSSAKEEEEEDGDESKPREETTSESHQREDEEEEDNDELQTSDLLEKLGILQVEPSSVAVENMARGSLDHQRRTEKNKVNEDATTTTTSKRNGDRQEPSERQPGAYPQQPTTGGADGRASSCSRCTNVATASGGDNSGQGRRRETTLLLGSSTVTTSNNETRPMIEEEEEAATAAAAAAATTHPSSSSPSDRHEILLEATLVDGSYHTDRHRDDDDHDGLEDTPSRSYCGETGLFQDDEEETGRSSTTFSSYHHHQSRIVPTPHRHSSSFRSSDNTLISMDEVEVISTTVAAAKEEQQEPRSHTPARNKKWIIFGVGLVAIMITIIAIALPAALSSSNNPDLSEDNNDESAASSSLVLATAPHDICWELVPGQGLSSICSPQETKTQGGGVANLVAYSRLLQISAADISLLNAGEVRADIRKGSFTEDDLYELLPFGNELLIFGLSGTQIVRVLEEALEYIVAKNMTGAYPYAAGLRYNVDYRKSFGNRCSNITVNMWHGQDDANLDLWEEIDLQHTYNVVTNSFLAAGGDGYMELTKVDQSKIRSAFIPSQTAFRNFIMDDDDGGSSSRRLVDPIPGRYSTQSFHPGSYNFSSIPFP